MDLHAVYVHEPGERDAVYGVRSPAVNRARAFCVLLRSFHSSCSSVCAYNPLFVRTNLLALHLCTSLTFPDIVICFGFLA